MADVENQKESSFPVKRKSDLYCQDQDNAASKAQKPNPSSSSAESESKDGEINGIELGNLNSSADDKIVTESPISPEKVADSKPEKDKNGVTGDLEAEDEEEEEEEEDSIEAEIDRKGKGISREDKGKLIEVDESDDEEDDSDDDEDEDGGDEYDDSDLSDDPLAEVDLDNILPSRTRRRSIQPGVYISNDRCGNNDNNEDDDSSDDSDA